MLRLEKRELEMRGNEIGGERKDLNQYVEGEKGGKEKK